MVTKRLQYRYDAVGNKVGMTNADGGLFTYTYDVMRRLTGVVNPLGERTTYTYDLNGRRTSVQLANGTRTSYSYDQGSRVQQIHTLKSNNSTVAKFDYAYDDNGRRTSVLEADGSRVTWTYDGTSQVTSEWRTGTSPFRHTFVYDTRGNRTLKVEDGARTTLVYDAANQLSSSEDAGGTTNYTYDGNGNQHVTVAPGGSRTTQIWDYENRLVKTLQPGAGVFTMAYDADGLRVRKETPSEAKLFVWDDQNYLAETDDSGVTEVTYTTEPSTYGSTISHRTGGATTTYHFDALAAARVLTNASETVLESYNYTAFGTIVGTPTLLTPFLWGGLVGYYWDADLATQYIRARHYQPHIARWISLDPIGFAGGDSNLFRYVGNSPTAGSTGIGLRLSSTSFGDMHAYVAESGLYYFRARMYEGRKEKFPSHDPILYPDGYNTYAGWFAISAVDPDGMAQIHCKLSLRGKGGVLKRVEGNVDCKGGNPEACCRTLIPPNVGLPNNWWLDEWYMLQNKPVDCSLVPVDSKMEPTSELCDILKMIKDRYMRCYEQKVLSCQIGNKCVEIADCAFASMPSGQGRYTLTSGGVKNWWGVLPVIGHGFPGGIPISGNTDVGIFVIDNASGNVMYVHAHPNGFGIPGVCEYKSPPTVKYEDYSPDGYFWTWWGVMDQESPYRAR